MSVEGAGQDVGRRALADGAVSAEHGDPGAGDFGDAASEYPKVFIRPRLSHVEDFHVPRCTGRRELRIVVQELMQTVYDVHPETHRLKHDTAVMFRQQACRRGDAEDEVVGYEAHVREYVREVPTDGDGVRLLAKHCARIKTGLLTVDDREDLIPLRVTNEPVGGLSIDGAEVRFAIHDGRWGGRRLTEAAVRGR